MPTTPRPLARRLLALVALLLAPGAVAGAQSVTAPGAGAARVYLEGGAAFDPTSWGVTGAYLPFVTPRLQAGLAPEYGGFDPPSGPGYHRYALAALANYLVPTGARGRAYAGGYLGGADATGARGVTTYGGQAGALYFVAPAAALRAEYRARHADVPGTAWQHVVVVALDPYVGGGTGAAGGRWRAPSLGAVDADFLANALLTGRNYYSARGTLAPFVAPWAQAGVRGSAAYTAEFGNRMLTQGTAFGRLYAPLAGRTTPYAEAFGSGYAGYGGADRVLDTYGAEGGVRRYVGPNAAFDLGLNWTRQRRIEVPGFGSFRTPDRTTVRLGVVTHLRARQAR